MLHFDIRGNLIPEPAIQPISIADFETHFVDDFEDSNTRFVLFEALQHYIKQWQTLISTDFEMWIDGTFITTKTNPKDIDILTFVDYQDYHRCKDLLGNQFLSETTKKVGIDAYVLKTYPIDHPSYPIYRSDYLYWLNHFGRTRLNRQKKQFKKGIIQLNFKS